MEKSAPRGEPASIATHSHSAWKVWPTRSAEGVYVCAKKPTGTNLAVERRWPRGTVQVRSLVRAH